MLVLKNDPPPSRPLFETCQFNWCDQPATTLAADRFSNVQCLCEKHVETFITEGGQIDPEYRVGCPNCGCIFGV